MAVHVASSPAVLIQRRQTPEQTLAALYRTMTGGRSDGHAAVADAVAVSEADLADRDDVEVILDLLAAQACTAGADYAWVDTVRNSAMRGF